MADRGYMLSKESAQRMATAVKRMERIPPGPPDDGTDGPGFPSQYIAEARCTSSTAANVDAEDKGDCDYPVFPGKLLVWDAPNFCWSDGRDVWLFDLNGGALIADRRYSVKVMDSHVALIDADPAEYRMLCCVLGGGSGSTGPGITVRLVKKVCEITE